MEIVLIASVNHFLYIYLIYKATRSIRRSTGPTTKRLVTYTPLEEPASQHLAVQKFKLLKTTNKWNEPSESEENIITLKSEVDALNNNANISKGNTTEKEKEI